MKIRRKGLKVVGLLLVVLALLAGTYKIAEIRTEKESYRQGYTNGYVRGVNSGVQIT